MYGVAFANYFVLVLLSFVSAFWRKVHTQTIESVDEDTIEAYASELPATAS